MKKLILICGLFLTISSFANELHNYNEISSTLTSGKSIHIVTDFTQCNTTDKLATQIMSVGIFTPNEIGITNEHIATAFTHFTVNDPYFVGKPVYEFVRYTITPDNHLTVALQIFDAATYNLLKNDISFACKIAQSAKIYS